MIVEFSDRALRNLEAIRDWIGEDDPVRADSYVDELIDACQDLDTFPRRFPLSRFRSARPLHQRVHGNHLILYDVGTEIVEIVAVEHGAQNLDWLLD